MLVLLHKRIPYGTTTHSRQNCKYIQTPIEGAIISLVKAETEEIIQYTQSNTAGIFEMSLPTSSSNLNLRIQHLDYALYHHALVFPVPYLNLTLKEQETVLEEIFIKPSPITQRHDTLSYRVEFFTSKTDRVLEDVLKRLPGIEVSASGQIKYQGANIHRFYVEGLDLMKGRYAAITKAISPDDISWVEVYEDHQPIKMLEGAVSTGKPALNIRLKNKISRAGMAKIGGGFSPFIWDVTLSPMLFSRLFQALGSYETNNTGSTLVTKMTNLYSFEEYDTFLYSPTNMSFLQIATNPDLSIKQNRYWFNQGHLGNLNVIQKLKQEWEFAATVYYLNEKNTADDRMQATTIHDFSSDTPIVYKRTTSSLATQETFLSTFTFTQNKKKNYTKNKTTLHVSRTKAKGNLTLHTPKNLIQQQTNAPAVQLQNTASTIIPLTEKHWINFRSLVDFSKNREAYYTTPTALFSMNTPDLTPYNSLNQQVENQSFYTRNALSYVWRKNNWTLSEEYNFTFQRTDFTSNLYGEMDGILFPTSDTYRNDLSYQMSSHVSHSKISFKSKRWSFNLNLPLDWNVVSLTNKVNKQEDNNRKLFFSPTLYAQYTASLRWTFRGNIAYNSVSTPLNQLYASPIFNALNFTSYTNKILPSHRFTTKVETSFKDPFTGWFSYMNLEYTQQDRPILFTKEISDNGQQLIQAVEQRNTKTTKQVAFNINKLIEPISTTVKANLSYSSSKDPQLINHIYNTVKTNQNIYRFSLSNTSYSWLNVDYSFTYQQRKNSAISSYQTSKKTHDATIGILPFSQHTLLATLSYQEDHIQQHSFTSTFLDLTYRYTFSKRKIDVEFAWTNLLNTVQYNQVILEDMMSSVTQTPIRPRQLLVSIRFSF